jgi:glycosyltransferase involved in cell wall biosynthesis
MVYSHRSGMASCFHQVLASHELGGAGLIALGLARELQDRGQVSHVWIPGEGPAQWKAEDLGLITHSYTAMGLFSSSKIRGIANNFGFWYNLSLHSPGLIHIHSPFHYRALLLALKLSRMKAVVHVQLEEDEEGLRWAFKTPPDLIITCARFLEGYVRRTLPERYQDRQRIIAVSNPVDTQLFHPGDRRTAKRHVGAPIDIPLALMLANLAPHKGQKTAIKAMAALKKAGVEAMLWLAGVERGDDRSYTTLLHNLCAELGVEDRVQFLGYRSDAAELLRATDIFLLPSTHEGLPLSVLEAQASKVPVLAAPTGGIPEVIADGQTGFLDSAADFLGYAGHIQTLLRQPDLYYRITEQAYTNILKEYTWHVYYGRLWQLYTSLLNID